MYKLLRVLDILGITSPDGTLPKEIGNLIHLTYLRIRSTNIRKLPKSIGKLKNLLTLDYWDVFAETEVQVPNVLWKLEKLRHLYLPNEMGGSIEALKLHTLKDLISLWGVGGGDWTRKEMGRLSSTLSKLYVHRISSKDQLKAVLDCPSMTENGCMYALALEWYGFKMKLDALSSKQGLRKLRLIGQAPDTSYNHDQLLFPSNLAKLELYYTKLERPETLSQLGKLVSLKVLKLSKDAYIGTKWCCRKEEFPALEELKLTSLPQLEDWDIEDGAMPCLKKLSIVSCIKLKRMPEGLMFVHGLEKLHIENMPTSFSTRHQKIKEYSDEASSEGEDYHITEHIPEVIIQDYSCASFR
ncbi:disease resistance protein RPP8-like [Silene latifolia]|uniref:disease resistance protein RPP8-like n=1 Tax=Silene latifolia TaxID=37657 RepID=UPI003D77E0E4